MVVVAVRWRWRELRLRTVAEAVDGGLLAAEALVGE